MKINGSDDRVILFAENIDESRQTLNKVVVKEATTLSIGRTNDNNLCYENKFVSGKHAKLSYDGNSWSISDLESTNGTYVNGYRVTSGVLNSGDFIYIMGLKIIVGNSFLAINNPDNLLHITSNSLKSYKPQLAVERKDEPDIPEKSFFFRSPRFHREIEHAEIRIDPPPQLQKQDTVPLALMLYSLHNYGYDFYQHRTSNAEQCYFKWRRNNAGFTDITYVGQYVVGNGVVACINKKI